MYVSLNQCAKKGKIDKSKRKKAEGKKERKSTYAILTPTLFQMECE